MPLPSPPNNQGIENIGTEVPQKAHSVLGHLLAAKKHKREKNRDAWQLEVQEALMELRDQKFADDKKKWKEEQKLHEQIRELTVQLDSNSAKKKQQEDIIAKWDEGNRSHALIRLATYENTDPTVFKTILDYMVNDELRKGDYGGIKRLVDSLAGADPKVAQTIIFNHLLKQNGMRNPNTPRGAEKITDMHGATPTPDAVTKASPSYNPVDVSNFLSQAQPTQTPYTSADMGDLNAFLGEDITKAQDIAQMRREGVSEADAIRSIMPETKSTTTKESDDVQVIRELKKMGYSDDQIIEYLMNQKSTTSSNRRTADMDNYDFYKDILSPEEFEEWKKTKVLGQSRTETDEQRLQQGLNELPLDDRDAIQALLTGNATEGLKASIRTLPGYFKSLNERVAKGEMTEKEAKDIEIRMVKETHYGMRPNDVSRQMNGFERILGFLNRVEDFYEEHPTFLDEDGNWDKGNPNILNRFAQRFSHAFGFSWDGDLDTFQTEFQWQLAMFIKDISGAQASDKEVERLMPVLPGAKDDRKLTKAKIKALRNSIENAFRIEFAKFPKSYRESIWQQAQTVALTEKQKAQQDIKDFVRENPDATEADAVAQAGNDENLISFARGLFTENADKVLEYFKENPNKSIDEMFVELVNNIELDRFDKYKEFIETLYNKAKGTTQEISEEAMLTAKGIKILQDIATTDQSIQTVSQFIAAVKSIIPESDLNLYGFTDDKLIEIWNDKRMHEGVLYKPIR